MARTLTFGILGLQDPEIFGWIEALAAHPACRLGPVWDPDPELVGRAAERFGAEPAPERPPSGRPVAGPNYVLHHPVAEAVLVGSAPDRRWVERAIQARKHWLALGPFTPYIQTFEILYLRTREGGRAGLVAMPRLFEPTLTRVAGLVRSGQVGRVLGASGTFWVKAGADSGWDPPIYPGLELFTYVVSTFGRPRRLYAEDQSGRLVSVVARLEGEGVLTLEFGRVLPADLPLQAEAVFEVVGETGAFRADATRGTVAFFGGGVEHHPTPPDLRPVTVEEFIRLTAEKDPAARLRPLEDVLAAYRVAEAVRRSLKNGQAVEITW